MPATRVKTFSTTRVMARAVTGGVYVGFRFTTVQQGELGRGVLAAMLRQLGIDRREF